MMFKVFTVIFALSLVLAACSGAATTAPVATESPASTQPGAVVNTQPAPTISQPTPYPEPAQVTAAPTNSAYPAPGTPGAGSPLPIPPSGYEPQPGDESLKRDVAPLDTEKSELFVTIGPTTEVKANLVGTLSDPCHKLRVVVTPPDAQNTIHLDVYSVADPKQNCIQMIEPFTALIPLGSYSSGHYIVNINGNKFGEFDSVFTPQPADDKLSRGEVFMDMEKSQLIFPGEANNKASAVLRGNLPDPCHQLRVVYNKADSANKINIEVYSVVDPKAVCTTVLQPFYVILPLGTFTAGRYSVYVNGQLLGEFNG